MAEYNAATDVYEHALVRVMAVHVRFSRENKDHLKISVRQVDGSYEHFTSSLPHGWNTQDEIVRKNRAAIAQVLATRFPDARWVHDNRTNAMCVPGLASKAAVKKAAPAWSMCMLGMSDRDGHHYWHCTRPVDGDHLCKVHQAAAERSAETRRRWDEEYRERQAESLRLDAIRDEIQELWDLVCDQREIERRGDPVRMQSGGVTVDHEILRTFLRELIDRA